MAVAFDAHSWFRTEYTIQPAKYCPMSIACNECTIRSRVDSHITTTYREFHRFLDALKLRINFNSNRTHIRTWNIQCPHIHLDPRNMHTFFVIHIGFSIIWRFPLFSFLSFIRSRWRSNTLVTLQKCYSFQYFSPHKLYSHNRLPIFCKLFSVRTYSRTHYVQKCHKNKS